MPFPFQFVTIQLAPRGRRDNVPTTPTFRLLQKLPAIGLDDNALGIEIEVCGEFRVTSMGVIGFQTKGELPPPMRILPENHEGCRVPGLQYLNREWGLP